MKFQVRWKHRRRAQSPKELDSYPQTPAAYYEGFYPGSKRVESNKVGFKRKLQTLSELNEFPATPILDVYPLLEKPQRVRFKRRHQALVHPIIVTAPVVPLNFPILQNANKIEFKRNALQLPEHNVFPQTPIAYYEGYFPASGPVKSYRVGFKRKRLDVELNQFPETPAPTFSSTIIRENVYVTGLKQNTAVSSFPFGLVDKDGNDITSGTVTGYLTIDGVDQGVITNTPTHVGNGRWIVDLTAAEMNGVMIGLLLKHPLAISVHFIFKTDTAITSEVKADTLELLARLTLARSEYLDQLSSGNIPNDIATLLTRLTAARAAALDNLDSPVSNINDLRRLLAAYNRL